MSFLKRLFSSNTAEPTQRVRICVECGMPVADHKDWCSIRRGQAEMELRKAGGSEVRPSDPRCSWIEKVNARLTEPGVFFGKLSELRSVCDAIDLHS